MRSDACWLLLLGVRTHGSQQKASPQLDQLITPGGSLRGCTLSSILQQTLGADGHQGWPESNDVAAMALRRGLGHAHPWITPTWLT